jgi:hypothetical protein
MIRSNLKDVIRRLEFYQAGLHSAFARACAPAQWTGLLLGSAQAVLQAAAAAEEREPGELARFVPDILATFRTALTAEATRYELRVGGDALAGFPVDLARARDTALGHGGGQFEFGSEQQNLQRAQELVERWVREEKRKGYHESDDEAVAAVMEILGLSHNPVRAYTPKMEEAAAGFLRHILPWLQEQTSATGGGLDAARVRSWAQLIFETWRDLVQVELPGKLRAQLNTLRRTAMKA